MTQKITLFLMACLICSTSKAQIATDLTLTPTQLVNQVLLGAGVTASNITFTGTSSQRAKFTATTATNLGLSAGVFLYTGDAATSSNPDGPQGPNNDTGAGTDLNGAGDADLTAISGLNTNDAAVLEFDFIPQADTLRFNYIFGSEEYLEYVGAINDAFAFLLTGPKPGGGNYSSQNIALIPGTTTPITINSVNNVFNSTFYRDNNGNTIDCEFDGLTTLLTAKAAVICGQTYHIKIAIADASDGILDSGVFLEAGSFASPPPVKLSTVNADSVIIEDCNRSCLYFLRTANISQKDSFQLIVNGDAILGTDYVKLNANGVVDNTFTWPSKIVFNAGQDTLNEPNPCDFFHFKALEDNTTEGLDTIVITLKKFVVGVSTCPGADSVTFRIYIKDYVPITIGQGDSTICYNATMLLNAQAQQGVPAYTYTWSPGGTNTAALNTGAVTQTKQYTITVNDFCNRPSVSKVVTVTPTTLPYLDPISSYIICTDSVKNLTVTPHDGKPGYAISWLMPLGYPAPIDTNGLVYTMGSTTPTADTYTVIAAGPQGTYSVVVTDQCNHKDTVYLNLDFVDCQLVVPNVVTPNGDGVNEFFKIKNLEIFSNTIVTIYNRWGNELYHSDDYKNNWKPDVTSGTYFYEIEIKDGRKFKGFFQVFKD